MKITLEDVTFLILVRFDTIERLENTLFITDFLLSNFRTNVVIWECAQYNNGFFKKMMNPLVEYIFVEDYDPILYRTQYLNKMALEAKTPFVAIWDTDVICNPQQITDSVEALRLNEADFSYPYKDQFLDTSSFIRRLFMNEMDGDICFLERHRQKMKMLYSPNPVGGAFFCNLEKYIETGLEDETFYGWGPEDGNRYVRWDRQGYKIKQIEGVLYHLSHPRGLNSLIQHPDQKVLKTREFSYSKIICNG